MKQKPSSSYRRSNKDVPASSVTPNYLTSIINSPNDIVIFSLDRKYCYTSFNNKHKETIKNIWEADIEIGQNMLDIIKNRKDRKKAKINFDRVLKGESFTLIEEYGEPPNRFYYEDIYSPVYDESGNITGLSLFLTDITEKVNNEKELNRYRNQLEELVKKRTRELEEIKDKLELDILKRDKISEELRRFEEIVSISTDMLALVDTTFTYLAANQAYLNGFKRKKEEIIGHTAQDIFGKTVFENVIKPRAEKCLAGEKVTYREWFDFPGCGLKFMDVTYNPAIDDNGHVDGFVVSSRDVTRRWEIEQALTEKEERYRTLYELSPTSIIVEDNKGNIIDVNSAFCNAIGYSREELIGNNISMLAHPEVKNQVKKNILRILEGESLEHVVRTLKKNKSLSYFKLHEQKFILPNGADGILCIAEDVTQQQQMEADLISNLDQTKKLHGIVERLNRAKTLQEVYSIGIQSIISVIQADRASILTADADGIIRFKGWNGLSRAYRREVEGHFPWDTKDLKAEPILVSNIADAEILKNHQEAILKEGIQAFAFIPLVGKVQLLGKFMIYYNQEHIFHPDEIFVAQVLADNLATVIDRIKSQEALQNSEKKYRQLIENANEAIFIVQDKDLRFANSMTSKITGYTNEELLSIPFLDLTYPDDHNIVFENYSKSIQGKPVPDYLDFRIINKKGGIKWVSIRSVRIDWDGKPAILNFSTDISEQKNDQQEINRLKEFNESIVTGIAEGIVVMDAAGIMEYANPAMAPLLGYEKEELIGKHWSLVVPSDYRSVVETEDKRREKGVSGSYEIQLERKDGKRIDVTVSGSPRFTEGKFSGTMAVFRDITERKQATEKLIANFDQTKRLRDMVEKLNRVEDLEGAYSTAVQSILSVIKADRASILLADSNGVVRFKAWGGLSEQYRKKTEGHFPWEISDVKAQPITIESISNADLSEELRATILKEGIHACSFIPLVGDDQLLGKFMTYFNREHIFTPDEINISLVLAENFSTVIMRIRNQQELKKSQEKYRATLESMDDLVFTHDKDGRFTSYYIGDKSKLAVPPEIFMGKKVRDVLPKNVAGKFDIAVERIKTKGGTERFDYSLEIGGDEFYFTATITGRKNVDGSFDGVTNVVTDITSQKLAEDTLRESEKKFRSVIEQSNDGIYVLQDNRFVFINSRYTEITGYNFEDVSGEDFNFTDIISEKGLKVLEERSEKKKRGEKVPGRYIFETIRKNGEKRDMEVSVTMIEWEDKPATLGIVSDVTERIQTQKELEQALEDAKQGEKVKTLFMANMSHEIRTPLNAILGFTDLIEMSTKDLVGEEEQEFFKTMKDSGQRLMRTVHEVLDISQIESGTYAFKIEKIDLNSITSSIIDICKPTAEQKELYLRFETDIDSALVKADKNGITQAISNIIENAIKYTNEGNITVSLIQKAKHYVLKIKDTGIGIADEFVEGMFEAFTQESEGYTKDYQGIGLGMAITKHHLDLNDVKVSVKSKKGRGTTFTLTFKMIKKSPRKKIVKEKETDEEVSANEAVKPMILLVEDDLNSRRLMEFFLNKRYDVCSVDSVGGAKKQLKKCPVELVLLDLSLIGNEDGLDLVRWMRKTKTWEKKPVIATTAHAFTKDKDNCINAGCNDYLSKPIKKEKLLDIISVYV